MKGFVNMIKKGLFKRLKNIGNAKKNKKKQNNNNNIKTKWPNVFNYWESLSPEAKDLIDEIEDANDDIDNGKHFLLVAIKKHLTLTLLINH